jgi:acetylornithine deacetylase/succinyl-diaminopimelate desuccinylase-like protein
MKAGCAAAILSLLILQKRKKEVNGELFLSLVFGEEAPFSLGADMLLREFDICDYQLAIIPEPSPLLTLHDYCCFHRRVHKSRFPVAIVGAEGRVVLEIEFHGKAAHASHPAQGINALHDAAQLITELSRFNAYSNITRGHGDYVILNIEGGDPTFTVPDYCKILVNRKMVLGENVRSVIREIKKIIRELHLKSKINIYQRQSPDPGLEYRPYVSKNNPYIDLFMENIVSIDPPEKIENGGKPLGFFNSSNCRFITRSVGDFNLVATRAKIPTLVFGPGGGHIHACNEFVNIPDLIATANHLVTYLMEIL